VRNDKYPIKALIIPKNPKRKIAGDIKKTVAKTQARTNQAENGRGLIRSRNVLL
jgi:hypothetical protein